MPCVSDYDHEDLLRCKAKLTQATRAACELAECLKQTSNYYTFVSKETQNWVRRHEEWDKRRKKEEEAKQRRKDLKKQALAKLSRKEKEVLGL